MEEPKHIQRTNTLHWFASPVLRLPKDGAPKANGDDKLEIAKPHEKIVHVDDEDDDHFHPVFVRPSQATPIELFYDLFFVANLSTYTAGHQVNSEDTIKAYFFFFTILWFTWVQVGLFDVRFGRDSVFDRICKLFQFGVMLGFSMVESEFNPSGGRGQGRYITLLLMISRFFIALQYLSVTWFLRRHRRTRLPMMILTAVYLASCAMFLGVAFAFPTHTDFGLGNKAYYAWYIIPVAETAFNIGISSVWRVLSFKDTHLVERMSLLTLIILGEGLVGLSQACGLIWERAGPSASFIWLVIATMCSYYFIYQIYFDRLPEEHFGVMRQQIWAFLHFPLHVALALYVEGCAQLILSNRADQIISGMVVRPLVDSEIWSNFVVPWLSGRPHGNFSAEFFEHAAMVINSTAQTVFREFPGGSSVSRNEEISKGMEAVANGARVIALYPERQAISVISFGVIRAVVPMFATVWEAFDIEPPSNAPDFVRSAFHGVPELNEATPVAETVFEFFSFLGLANLVFIYFFVGIGSSLVILGVLYWLGLRSHKNKPARRFSDRFISSRIVEYVRIGTYFVVGLLLALLSLIVLDAEDVIVNPSSSQSAYTYISSAWVIPTAMFGVFLVLIIEHLPV